MSIKIRRSREKMKVSIYKMMSMEIGNKKEAVSQETASRKEVIKVSKYQIPNLYPKVRVNIFRAVLRLANAGSTPRSTGYKKYFCE